MLEAAWRQVRANALRSESQSTAQKAREFETKALIHIASIQRRLRSRRFKFDPAQGVLIKKPGKTTKRPIVIAPIESRIVQRALLEVIQSIAELKAALEAGYNFGGVAGKGFGVPAAMAKAVAAASRHGYYIRTDIQSFFTQVPRQKAIDVVLNHVNDPDFAKLFEDATKTELQNLGGFSDQDIRLFPLHEAGVAQGSCLSPLLCNLLLADFDREMNSRGVECIRYIDDFILFAKDHRTVRAAFNSARKHLKALGLDVYDPNDRLAIGKAEKGSVNDGFQFLGCEISPTQVRPSKENRKALLTRIKIILDEALIAIRRKTINAQKTESENPENFSSALYLVSNIIRGWGNTYQFCSDDRLMRDLDFQIDSLVIKFHSEFSTLAGKLAKNGRTEILRKILGVFSLEDCKRDDSNKSARTIALMAQAASRTDTNKVSAQAVHVPLSSESEMPF